MKCVVFCLAVVLGAASAVPKWADYPCPDFCPQIYKPVCGSDGVETMTFSNECVMRAQGCLKSQRFLVKSFGICAEEVVPAVETRVRDCGVCPYIYDPVCASNGNNVTTFASRCTLDVYNCENPTEAKFIMTRSGECEERVAEPLPLNPVRDCGVCPLLYAPVCASNGQRMVTFGNKCALRVHNCEHPTEAKFVMTRSGECDERVAEPAPLAPLAIRDCGVCPMILAPVCASNGQRMMTFDNKCALRVHNCEHPTEAKFVMTRSGECEEQVEDVMDSMPLAPIINLVRNCGICPMIFAPVCASNGQKMMTFSNDCSLRVYNCEHPWSSKFVMTRSGECDADDVVKVAEPVAERKPNCGPCTRIYRPVCASDGQTTRTFGNKCTLDAHNCENPQSAKFVMTRSGECDADEVVKVAEPVAERKPFCGPCTFIYLPVCASDGQTTRTFGNKCTLDVHNCENPKSAKFVMTRAGEC